MAVFTGTPNADNYQGPNELNYIYGLEGNDQLFGGIQTDVIFGGDGDDFIDGGEGTDFIYGGAASGDGFIPGNVLNGGGGNDYIYGGDDFDVISGGQGVDWILGYGGDDFLTGDDVQDATAGADIIYTGTGSDVVIPGSAEPSKTNNYATDFVGDFNPAEDKFAVIGLFMGVSDISDIAIVSNDSSAATSSAIITYSQSTGTVFYNSNGAVPGFGAVNQPRLLTVFGAPALTVGNFDFDVALL